MKPKSALETTHAIRAVRHDALGFAKSQGTTRAPERVRAIVEALGVDGLAPADCPADYSVAELSVVLAGNDVYAKRTAYVFGLFRDPPARDVTVVVVRSSGCRGGSIANAAALRRELAALRIVD